jgi:phage shock protein A
VELTDLKSLIPIILVGLSALIAVVKLSSRVVRLEEDLRQLTKVLGERDTYTQHVKLAANVDAIEKHATSNITSLWQANEQALARLDRYYEKIDGKIQFLREKINGGPKH